MHEKKIAQLINEIQPLFERKIISTFSQSCFFSHVLKVTSSRINTNVQAYNIK